jgi:hypothetical protein
MEPIRSGQLKSVIDSAYVVRLDTGEKLPLSTKGDSYCHFFDPITIEKYKIIFRLDWSMLDAGGHPTLDADFYDIKTNEKLPNIGELQKAHHTKTKDSRYRIFEWEFREMIWPFKVVVHWLISVQGELHISENVSCEVFRNGIRVDE